MKYVRRYALRLSPVKTLNPYSGSGRGKHLPVDSHMWEQDQRRLT